MTRGLRFLSALNRADVRATLDWSMSLGLLSFIIAIGLGAYLGFAAPTDPLADTGQVHPWRSHGAVLFVRRAELIAMNVGLGIGGPVFFITKMLHAAIFGVGDAPRAWLNLFWLVPTALVSIGILFVSLRSGGAWPYAIAP